MSPTAPAATEALTLQMQTSIRQHPDRFSAEVDGDILMMHPQTGDYFGLNPVGSFIWKLLERPRSVAGICAAVGASFAVDAARCESDTLAFLRQMIEADLLLAKPAGGTDQDA